MTPSITIGPHRPAERFDDEFHDSVRRCVAVREQLKAQATATATQRGHSLGSWVGYGLDEWVAACSKCGASVKVLTTWPQVSGSATGAALSSDCRPLQ